MNNENSPSNAGYLSVSYMLPLVDVLRNFVNYKNGLSDLSMNRI